MEAEAQLHERLFETLFGADWQSRTIQGDDEMIHALAVTLASVVAIHPDAETPEAVRGLVSAVSETIEASALNIWHDVAEAGSG